VQPRVARWFLFGMGFQYIEVKGYLRRAAEVPILIVSPHATILDTFFMAIFTLPSAVVKEEARHIPLFGSKCVLCIVCVCVCVCVCMCFYCSVVYVCVCCPRCIRGTGGLVSKQLTQLFINGYLVSMSCMLVQCVGVR